MGNNFYPCDRDQLFLLPPSMADWLPKGHLAYFIMDCTEQFDLTVFYGQYREDGRGHAAYNPSMLLALLLYCYAIGIRSSRQIEKACVDQVAMRIITANQAPDHSTISRFRKKFLHQINGLFTEVLELCQSAGMVRVGQVAIDGTKIKADAAMEANAMREEIARKVTRILEEAERIDAEEDARFGEDRRGDELPEELSDPATRPARLRAIKDKLDRVRRAEGKIEKHAAECQEEYQNKRAAYDRKVAEKKGRGRPPVAPSVEQLDTKANTTDPDSRIHKTRGGGHIQGYNCQAAVDVDTQLVLAADVVSAANDVNELTPMITKTVINLKTAGIDTGYLTAMLADAGYWSHGAVAGGAATLSALLPDTPPELLLAVPPQNQKLASPVADDPPPSGANTVLLHEHKQRCPAGRAIYKKRRRIEPVFGQIKNGRKFDRFQQRGKQNVSAEWTLMCTTHNLLKLWRRKIAQPAQNALLHIQNRPLGV